MIVRAGTSDDVRAAARLHVEQISEGFLSSLGAAFVERLYRRVVKDPQSFLVVATEGDVVIGMASGTASVPVLYKSFLFRDSWRAALQAAPKLARSAPRVIETVRYGRGEASGAPAAELLAVAVDSHHHGAGIGRRLVVAAQDAFQDLGVDGARVVAAADNRVAIGLYESCGFRPVVRTEVHAGAASQILAWP